MFNGLKLTNKGMELLSNMLTGHIIQFTNIKMGDGDEPSDILALTDLVSTKQSLNVARQSVIDTTTVLVGGNLFGNDVTTGFYWKEVGVFAKDVTAGGTPVLFSYGYATDPSFIPTGGTVAEMLIDLNVKVGNVDNVDITIDSSLVFVTQEMLDTAISGANSHTDSEIVGLTTTMNTHINNKSNPHATTKTHVGLGSVENYGISTEAEAKAGSSSSKYMTPQRVKQAVEAYSVISDGNIIIKIGGTQPSAQTGKTIIWIDTSS